MAPRQRSYAEKELLIDLILEQLNKPSRRKGLLPKIDWDHVKESFNRSKDETQCASKHELLVLWKGLKDETKAAKRSDPLLDKIGRLLFPDFPATNYLPRVSKVTPGSSGLRRSKRRLHSASASCCDDEERDAHSEFLFQCDVQTAKDKNIFGKKRRVLFEMPDIQESSTEITEPLPKAPASRGIRAISDSVRAVSAEAASSTAWATILEEARAGFTARANVPNLGTADVPSAALGKGIQTEQHVAAAARVPGILEAGPAGIATELEVVNLGAAVAHSAFSEKGIQTEPHVEATAVMKTAPAGNAAGMNVVNSGTVVLPSAVSGKCIQMIRNTGPQVARATGILQAAPAEIVAGMNSGTVDVPSAVPRKVFVVQNISPGEEAREDRMVANSSGVATNRPIVPRTVRILPNQNPPLSPVLSGGSVAPSSYKQAARFISPTATSTPKNNLVQPMDVAQLYRNTELVIQQQLVELQKQALMLNEVKLETARLMLQQAKELHTEELQHARELHELRMKTELNLAEENKKLHEPKMKLHETKMKLQETKMTIEERVIQNSVELHAEKLRAIEQSALINEDISNIQKETALLKKQGAAVENNIALLKLKQVEMELKHVKEI